MVLTLLNHMAVLILVAYILTRTKLYTDVLVNKKINFKNSIILILIFGGFSIFGTVSGIHIYDAIASIRDLGPAIAGLIAGPIVGIGAGLIGAIHRYSLGGSTALPCSLATIFAGFAGGMIFIIRKGKVIKIYEAVIFAVCIELFHMMLVLFICSFTKSFNEAILIVQKVIIPMVVVNAVGIAIFVFIATNLIKERNTELSKERIESELRIAHDIQMGIVPKIFPPFPDRKEFDIHAVIEPAKEVGGDFYDFFFIDENRLCFSIADVSGKGVPASLFMAVTKTLVKAKSRLGITPDKILSEVNNELCDENDSCMFVTIFCGILNTQIGEVEYSNGGHNLPYLIKNNNTVEQLENTSGMALGVICDTKYFTKKIKLLKSDSLYLYTDGVNEAMDKDGNQFSCQRLERFLKKSNNIPTKEITQNSINEIKKFTKGAAQSDDITILVLKYLL